MQNHHISKRRKRALRFFSYGMMTFAVIVISVICLLLLLGYRFDGKSGTLEQGGLLQFRSFPSGATIELDGQVLGFKSPGKFNVDSGDHTVVMKLDNYQEWRKTVFVQPGELKWLNYARFIPNNLTSTSIAAFGSMADALPSPDRKWYALLTDAAAPTITLYDIRRPSEPTVATLQIPAEAVTQVAGQPHRYSLQEWDFGGRYILVRHQVGETVEYIRVDRTVANGGVNITRTFNIGLSQLHFSGTSGNVFYGLTGSDIRKVDLGDKTISQPLTSGVTSFQLYGSDVIAYVADRQASRVAGVIVDGDDVTVRTYTQEQPVMVGVTSYFDHVYLAVAHGANVEVVKDPEQSTPTATEPHAAFVAQSVPAWMRLSSSGRFVTLGRGVNYTTHDLETKETFTAAFDGQRTDEARPLQWIDDYYLAADTNGIISIGEFDGANRHELVRAVTGFAVTLSQDGEYLFSIGRSDSGTTYMLQSTKMTLN